ncbi:tubulin-folding cofactor B [Seriola lalandi dorsalis]|uniref:tubulin-folding cofactor B n=1 Tax=Seriola lalandi dorsalis TaxID=1841481 RepID=UPI000C6F7771|nr:tubulin-folding cofactor B [Seriola lalandi dorsalis]
MDGQVTIVTNPTVNVRLTSTIISFETQRRFNRGISVAELKKTVSFLAQVIDRSGGQMGEFTDVSKVEKFELSDEAYDKKTDSARSFMKKQRVGRFNEEEVAKKKADLAAREEEQKAAADAISVGSRCQVHVPGQPTKVGTVMYVGTADFKPGFWVGVKYDEPLGKHDGIVEGKRYFDCENKYGAFVKPLSVTVGDFPEEDYGLDEM